MDKEDIKNYSTQVISLSYSDIKGIIDLYKIMPKKEEEKFLESLKKDDIENFACVVSESLMTKYWIALIKAIKKEARHKKLI